MRTGTVFAGVLALMAAAEVSQADVLQMQNGRTIEGLVVQEGDAAVVVAIKTAGGFIRTRFLRSEIVRITRAPLSEPAVRRDVEENGGVGPEPAAALPSHSYYVIPISGEIGRAVTKDVVEAALREARLRNPDVVVLEINSPGGHVLELKAILGLLADHRDLRLVAYVKNALSEAAAIAVACTEVYVDRSSRIGGALSFAAGKNDLPKDFENLYQHVWRGTCQQAVQIGRRSPLIAEGMTNPAIELFIANVGGKLTVSSKAPVDGAIPFKRRGRLLTLTSREAVECGLAVAEIGDYTQLGVELGVPGWRKQGSAEGILCKQKAELLKAEKALMRDAGLRQLKIAWWSKYRVFKAELDRIRDALPKLWAEGRALEETRRQLQDQYIYEINKINRIYDFRAAAARQAMDPKREEIARRMRDEKTMELNFEYEHALAPLKDKLARLEADYREKARERHILILSLELP